MHGKAAVSHSYLRLLQMGFTKPCCYQHAGALLPHRFSFSRRSAAFQSIVMMRWKTTDQQESSFLWHCPSGHPAQPLAGILPFEARTFLTAREAQRGCPTHSYGILANIVED